MIKFLKNSIRELKHVVWPTKNETKKYFIIVITILIIFGFYLFLSNIVFSNVLFYLKDFFGNTQIENNIPSNLDLNLLDVNTGSIDNQVDIKDNTGSIEIIDSTENNTQVNTGIIIEGENENNVNISTGISQ